MKTLIAKTEKCRNFNHPEFQFSYCPDIILQSDVFWLIKSLEDKVMFGEVFKDRDTMQIGWMINSLNLTRNGVFELYEPDMQSMPISWIKSVNTTLHHIRKKKDTSESLNLNYMIEFANIYSSAIVGKKFDICNSLVMERTPPDQNDSGWFIGSADHDIDFNDPLNLERISLYELGCRRADIVMYLSLPPNIKIITSGKSIEVTFNGEKIVPYHQSFLDDFLKPLKNIKGIP